MMRAAFLAPLAWASVAATATARAEPSFLQPTTLGFAETREPAGVEFVQNNLVFMGAVSTTAPALKSVELSRMVRSELALTVDNRWVHWRVEAGSRRIVDLSEIAVSADPAPSAWQTPDRRQVLDQPSAAPRLQDCRFLSDANAGRRWIGLWRCADKQTTLASWRGDAATPSALTLEAVINHTFSVISSMPANHGGGSYVHLAEVEPKIGKIDYLRAFWRH